jgi:hypothetical protein
MNSGRPIQLEQLLAQLQTQPQTTEQLLQMILLVLLQQNNLLLAMVGEKQAKLGQLSDWQKKNPRLVRKCRDAANTLNNVQMDFVSDLADEVCEMNNEVDNTYALNELLDRHGGKLMQINVLLQVLGTLGAELVRTTPPPGETV